jgi:hypothetical protein
MRIAGFMEEPRVVRSILERLSSWDAPRPRPPPVDDAGPADCGYVSSED